MGNCFGTSDHDPDLNRKSLSTPGQSSDYSKSLGFSATSSSAAISQFSDAASVPMEGSHSIGQILVSSNLKEFTFSELKSATKNFKSDHFLGQGGFGKVYKGWVDEKTLAPSKSGTGMMVAIKKLNSESVQGFQEWQSEVSFLGRLSHPNLVKLLGYCLEDTEMLLVYEFMPKGSLENHLFRRSPSIDPLSWEKRLKIAIGAAKGLAFLHSSEKHVIYRDFKASNILLDGYTGSAKIFISCSYPEQNYSAKISDFGLAKLGPLGEATHVTTQVMGTYGYAAPEYFSTGHLYVKSDVYGFGVVLLELLTGLRALDSKRVSEERNLVDWLKPVLIKRKKIKTIMDQKLEGQYSTKAVLMAADLTLKCLESDPKNRPSMKDVLETLERIEAIKDKPKPARLRKTSSSNADKPRLHQLNSSPFSNSSLPE